MMMMMLLLLLLVLLMMMMYSTRPYAIGARMITINKQRNDNTAKCTT